MTRERHEYPEVDDLLREALPGDLPADVAAGMRETIERFRAGQMKIRTPASAWLWVFRRSVLAALSFILLVAGIILQGAGAPSPLARRISSIKTALETYEPIRR